MGVYVWRVPRLKAVQFDGKNNAEIKALLGDESPGEEPSVGTGKFEEPPKQEKKPETHGHEKDKAPAPEPPPVPAEPPKEIREKLKLKEGDWVTVDLGNGKVEVNPKDFPEKYDYVG